MRAKVEALKDEIIANKAVTAWIDGLWENARAGLLKAARDPDATMAGKFGDALRQLGDDAAGGPAAQARDQPVRPPRRWSARSPPMATSIVTLVSETVRGWDAKTITDRLEAAVGRDLQYIRINGTLVGGLVGLAIHAAEVSGL